MLNFLKKKKIVPVVYMSGIIGNVGALKNGITISSTQDLLEKAFKIKNSAAVALIINSPGGSPTQSSLIYKRIKKLAKKNKTKVIFFVEDVAASGGYYIACAGDEIYVDENSIVGSIGVIYTSFGFDKLIKTKNFKSCNFELRFHLLPEIKLTKLLNNQSILIESNNAGWKFTCENHNIDIETGLYFGMKNKYLENKNILVSGLTNPEEQNIFWEISKI